MRQALKGSPGQGLRARRPPKYNTEKFKIPVSRPAPEITQASRSKQAEEQAGGATRDGGLRVTRTEAQGHRRRLQTVKGDQVDADRLAGAETSR